MVVLIIIAVIIAIVLPALGSARRAARAATTRSMMTNICNAAGVFINDNKRSPGYFTARQMADSGNLTQGFTAMQNVMLDLAGGIDPNQTTPPATDLLVGPGTSGAMQVYVNPDLMGSTSGGNSRVYFAPDAKHWVAQNASGQQVGAGDNVKLRSVVDDFGNPILAWVIDDTAVGQITQVSDFAKDKIANQNTDKPARFYWAPNAAFLCAGALGTRAYDQTGTSGSMIGSTSASTSPQDVDKSLCGLLGNPSFPYRAPAAAQAPTVPASARAPFVLQSAGGDGIFLGKKDRGAKQFSTGYVDYQMGFVKTSGAPETQPNFYLDKDGKRETYDVTKAFDDILTTGGN